MSKKQNTNLNFKGFGDWSPIFKSGAQTDSKGRKTNFTTADLDSIVANHEPAPMVVGHPSDTAPAYGWTDELKREGDTLFSKFKDVNSDFEKAVEAKSYPKRSISIVPADDGYRLRHVGFLGGVAPAIKGLEDISFSENDNAMEFSVSWRAGNSISTITKLMRGIREWIIEMHGKEVADNVVSGGELDWLERDAEEIKKSDENSNFNEGDNMSKKEYSEAEIEKITADAVATANAEAKTKIDALEADKQKAFSDKVSTETGAFIEKLKAEGKLLPAHETGMKDFMTALATDEGEASFDFSEGDKTKQGTAFDWFKNFMSSQAQAIDLNNPKADSDDMSDMSQEEIRQKAHEYKEANPGVSNAEAINYVTGESDANK